MFVVRNLKHPVELHCSGVFFIAKFVHAEYPSRFGLKTRLNIQHRRDYIMLAGIGIGIISCSGGLTAGLAVYGIACQLRENLVATCLSATAR